MAAVVIAVVPQQLPTIAAPACFHATHAWAKASGVSCHRGPSCVWTGSPALGRTVTSVVAATIIRGTAASAAASEQQLTPTALAPCFSAYRTAPSMLRPSPIRSPLSSMAKLTKMGMPSAASQTPANSGCRLRIEVTVSTSKPSTPALSNACSRAMPRISRYSAGPRQTTRYR